MKLFSSQAADRERAPARRITLGLAVLFAAATMAGHVDAAPPDGYLQGSTVQLGIPSNGLPPHAPTASPAPATATEHGAPLLSITGEESEPSAAAPSAPPAMSLEEVRGKLEKYLRESFHQPRRLAVSIEPEAPTGLADGHFQRIDVAVEDGHIDAIPVSSARVAFYDVAIDMALLREHGWVHWHSRSPADAHIVISQANVNETLRQQQQMLRIENPHMTFKPGRITFSGRMHSLFGAHRVTTTGTLRLVKDSKINYHPEHLALGALTVPHGILGMIERKVNPIIDLTRLGPLGGVELKLRRLLVTASGLEVATRTDSSWETPLAWARPAPER